PTPITGLVAAPFTPMHADGSIALDKIEAQAHSLAASGVSGGFVCGTTGESLSLSVDERMQVMERWAKVAPDGFHVIAHVGHNSLDACKTLAAHAQSQGVRAMGIMPPCFFRPAGIDGLVDWCAAVADAAPELPLYYYHIPSMTGVDVHVAEFLEAASDRIPSLAGVKFTYEDLLDLSRCIRCQDGRFDILFGRDEILLAGLALGAKGAVGSTYNFAAPIYLEVIAAFEAGDMARARVAQAKAADIIVALLRYGGTNAFKATMDLIGLDLGPVRPPLVPLTDAQIDALRADLDALGFFDWCNRA
ncbi:dihydrodipicolinate synthase family protein, partial [bacterium]|nr:dihydrodipicolinate synthase family protein [bacterium]